MSYVIPPLYLILLYHPIETNKHHNIEVIVKAFQKKCEQLGMNIEFYKRLILIELSKNIIF